MIKINFYPDSDLMDFSEALGEYKKIWEEDGEKIINEWESYTGFKFKETEINSVIFAGRSHSHPLSLRYSNTIDKKKATLVHELGHRLIVGNANRTGRPSSLDAHKELNLVLYDVSVNIYGEAFANEMIEIEKAFDDMYKEAWEWALQFSKEERLQKFKEIMLG